jgi:hypothetical protein
MIPEKWLAALQFRHISHPTTYYGVGLNRLQQAYADDQVLVVRPRDRESKCAGRQMESMSRPGANITQPVAIRYTWLEE